MAENDPEIVMSGDLGERIFERMVSRTPAKCLIASTRCDVPMPVEDVEAQNPPQWARMESESSSSTRRGGTLWVGKRKVGIEGSIIKSFSGV